MQAHRPWAQQNPGVAQHVEECYGHQTHFCMHPKKAWHQIFKCSNHPIKLLQPYLTTSHNSYTRLGTHPPFSLLIYWLPRAVSSLSILWWSQSAEPFFLDWSQIQWFYEKIIAKSFLKNNFLKKLPDFYTWRVFFQFCDVAQLAIIHQNIYPNLATLKLSK